MNKYFRLLNKSICFHQIICVHRFPYFYLSTECESPSCRLCSQRSGGDQWRLTRPSPSWWSPSSAPPSSGPTSSSSGGGLNSPLFCCSSALLVDSLTGLTSDEELDSRGGREQFVELDSLDTEKALLLTDDDDALWVCGKWLVILFSKQSVALSVSDGLIARFLTFKRFIFRVLWWSSLT